MAQPETQATHLSSIIAAPLPPDAWFPPTEDDLPSEDGMPMDTPIHRKQMELLANSLATYLRPQDAFVGANMFVYYHALGPNSGLSVGPDMFVVLGVPNHDRKSWVIWREQKAPDLVIELLSPSTARNDFGEKKDLYQDVLRVPEYVLFDPFSGERAGFAITKEGYVPLEPDEQGRLVSKRLGLALADWEGTYVDITRRWLRWYTLEGELVMLDGENAQQQAELERQRAEAAEQAAELERARAEQERDRATELEALLARYRAQFGDLNEAK